MNLRIIVLEERGDYLKIGVYNIINDPFPKLNLIKTINIKKSECKCDTDMVNMMNRELLLNKLSSEHIFALVFNLSLTPLGVLQLGVGNHKESFADMKTLGCGLLLLGGEQFVCFHNHPGGVKTISQSDKELTSKYEDVADLFNIYFIRHLMVTKDNYVKCPDLWR